MTESLDFTHYTDDQLTSAFEALGSTPNPELAELLKRELARRAEAEMLRSLPDAKPTVEPPTPKGVRRRRLLAFVIDFGLVTLLYGIVNNLIPLPVPRIVSVVGMSAFFCLYFIFTESGSGAQASPGKRITGITVVSIDGGPISIRSTLTRSLLVSALTVINWEFLLFGRPVALLWLTLIWSVPVGLALYNAWLGSQLPDQLMIQDRMTRTRVVGKNFAETMGSDQSPPSLERVSSFPDPLFASALVIGMTVLSLVSNHFSTSRTDLFTVPESNPRAVAVMMESHLYEMAGLRSEIDLTTDQVFGVFGRKDRELQIDVWIPAVRWSESTQQQVLDYVLEPLAIEIGFYDVGTLRIWTGTRYMKTSRSFPLNLP